MGIRGQYDTPRTSLLVTMVQTVECNGFSADSGEMFQPELNLLLGELPFVVVLRTIESVDEVLHKNLLSRLLGCYADP